MVAIRACGETGVGHFDLWNTMLLLLHSINERVGGGPGQEVELPLDWLGETIGTWMHQKNAEMKAFEEADREFNRSLKGR